MMFCVNKTVNHPQTGVCVLKFGDNFLLVEKLSSCGPESIRVVKLLLIKGVAVLSGILPNGAKVVSKNGK